MLGQSPCPHGLRSPHRRAQVDLSRILFLCTANMLDTIPGPLLDRMEVVRLSGYVTDEKMAIMQKYLYPNARQEMGIAEDQMELADSAALKLIRWYCREAGVRNLQKHTEKICRKVALKVVTGEPTPLRIDDGNLEDYVGKPQWHTDRIYGDDTPPGVVMGLAWTSMGGSVLYIETVENGVPAKRGRAGEGDECDGGGDDSSRSSDSTERSTGGGGSSATLVATGQLGDVMRESTRIAQTVARRVLRDVEPQNAFLDHASLHMHVPEGATPKDGPSAGIAMVTSLLSIALDRPVRKHLAMTGEVSLTGLVLPIGGVKEKTVAAQRAGVKHIILPFANQRDFMELPENLREGLEVHFVRTFTDVYHVALDYGSSADESEAS